MVVRHGRESRWWGIVGVLWALAIYPALAQIAAEPDIFTVAGVPVDVTARSAAQARTQALAEGQRRALQTLLQRMTSSVDHERLPQVGDPAIGNLVQGLEIAAERTSSTRYIARLTVRFKPDGVRNLLRNARIAYSETVSKPIVVIPVFEDANGRRLWGDENPWRTAWMARERQTGLVRLILPLGDFEDIAAIGADAALAGNEAALLALTKRYGLNDTLVAHARLEPGAIESEYSIAVQMQRRGTAGVSIYSESFPGTSLLDDFNKRLDQIVEKMLVWLEQDWKRGTEQRLESAAALDVRVPLGGLGDWIALRQKLEAMGEVRRLEVLALARGEARVTLHYFGDPARLAVAMAQRDLDLKEEQGAWTIRPAGGAPAAPAPPAASP
jgi:hypothetical protein